ncbi:hypothetical protein BHM03_00031106 [Ensete ventricosum]|uniref:Uncharacterized protein n=1 Tax=Ensete ventricosum TaxID=4639 RepID=A0A445MID3_ENSVE|nr:hypothetical protein BHM03_00031106 [Ensete ventricosum]
MEISPRCEKGLLAGKRVRASELEHQREVDEEDITRVTAKEKSREGTEGAALRVVVLLLAVGLQNTCGCRSWSCKLERRKRNKQWRKEGATFYFVQLENKRRVQFQQALLHHGPMLEAEEDELS